MTATTQVSSLPLSRGPLRRGLIYAIAGLLVIGAVGAGVAYATTRPDAPLMPGTARLIPGDAAVTVHRGTPVAAADALLRAGDTLIVEHGQATIRTAAGSIYARSGSALAITDGAPRITRGDVLVRGKAFEVTMRSASAQVNGVARIRQGLSLEVAVYQGGAVVRSVTETVGVRPLRRAVVAGSASSVSITRAPLVLSPTDKWDRRFLGEALELDAALSARSRGITMLVAERSAQVVDQVAASTGWAALSVLKDQPVGEIVVATELARAAKLGPEAVGAALKLRAEGASWGLIALEQGIDSLPAGITGLDDVVVPTAPVVQVTTPTLAPVQTTPTLVPTTPKVTVPKTSVVGNQPPVTVPSSAGDGEPNTPVAGVVDTVDDLLGGLLGGL